MIQRNSTIKYFILSLFCMLVISSFKLSSSNAAGSVIVELGELTPEIFILSVGIDKYKTGNILFANKDATSLSKTLGKNLGFLNEGTHAKYEVKRNELLLDENAKKEDIIEALDELTKEITSNDIFIFYFGGGGFQSTSEDFFLYTTDADWSKSGAGLAKEREEKAISGELLKSYFARMRAKTKVLIFDTGISSFVCEKGDSFFSQTGGNSLFIGTKTASFDIPEKQTGAVTGLILDAIKGDGDSNYDGVINAWEILSFIGNAKNNKKLTPGERKIEFCTSTQGNNFDLTLTDKIAKEIELKEKENSDKTAGNDSDRSKPVKEKGTKEKIKKREGDDYALLFAFENYDDGWTELKNPQNDIKDVERELRNRFKFKEVVTKVDLTIDEFDAVIKEYKEKEFKEDDQLFIFFAGHGVVAEQPPHNGFLVAKDSLPPSIFGNRKTDSYIKLDVLLGDVSMIKSKHIMVVFDACFAGQIWSPSMVLVQDTLAQIDLQKYQNSSPIFSKFPIFGFQPRQPIAVQNVSNNSDDNKLTKDELIARELKDVSRVVLTSGHDVVSDGKPGTNSPFAAQFLEALKKGADENGLVTLPDIMRFVKRARNKTSAALGRIDRQGKKSTGGFVLCEGGCNNKPEESKGQQR